MLQLYIDRADASQGGIWQADLTELDVTEAPRNSREIHNSKSSERRRDRAYKGQTQCTNFADEFQTVQNKQSDKALPDQFVRC